MVHKINAMINVVLVEDQFLIRTAIKTLFENIPDIKIIHEANTGTEALKIIRRVKPDIVLLDIDLPDIGGLEIARRLLRYNSKIKIIILTAFINDVFPKRLMQMGVSGYLIQK